MAWAKADCSRIRQKDRKIDRSLVNLWDIFYALGAVAKCLNQYFWIARLNRAMTMRNFTTAAFGQTQRSAPTINIPYELTGNKAKSAVLGKRFLGVNAVDRYY